MKALKLSIVALSLGLFAASCGDTGTETPKPVDSTNQAPKPEPTPEPTPAPTPAANDTNNAAPTATPEAAPQTATPEAKK